MTTDGGHELVRGDVRDVEAGQAAEGWERGHQHRGDLPVLRHAVPQPVAENNHNVNHYNTI